MAVNYDEIRQRNIEEYGKGTRHLAYLSDLYSTRTHFLFELLQNTEDALGKRKLHEEEGYVEFCLHSDRLELRHNGKPFDEENVIGVCGIGEGTKAGDFSQIGKFGIGFKSVYAFTLVPQIHSGDEHFEIRRFVEPHALVSSKIPSDLKKNETRIVLPFDDHLDVQVFRKNIPHETAVEEISNALKNLGLRTLLFLRNIKDVRWILPDGTSGTFLRDLPRQVSGKPNARYVDVTDGDKIETWLVFERQTEVEDEGYKHYVTVEVAFLIQDDKVLRAKDTELVVFFPTAKKTELGFLIQGPFKTTKDRGNIADPNENLANKLLIETAAQLTADSLEDLSELGLLSAESYDVFPLEESVFQEKEAKIFRPFYDKLYDVLRYKPVLPRHGGGYVSAVQSRLAGSEDLRDLLNDTEQLAGLFASPENLFWLSSDITERRTPQLWRYLKNTLAITEVDGEKFVKLLTTEFLQSLDDGWFARFYEFLLGREALWRPPKWGADPAASLRNKAFLKLEDGSLVTPFKHLGNPNAYLPPEHSVTVPVVCRSITNHKPALDFLKRLGLEVPDEVADVVQNILPKYLEVGVEQIDAAVYQSDLKAIFRALKTDSQQKKNYCIQEARKTPFIKSINAASGEVAFKRPGEVYLNTEDMLAYFSGNQHAWISSDIASEFEDDEISSFWKDLGVSGLPRRVSHGKRPSAPLHKSTKNETVVNYDLDGLDFFLRKISSVEEQSDDIILSKVMWNILVQCLGSQRDFISGRHDFFSYTPKWNRFDADFVQLLRENRWLLTRNEELKSPNVVRRNEIHPDLQECEELCQVLHIKPNNVAPKVVDRQAYLQAFGISREDLEIMDFCKEHQEEFLQLKSAIMAKKEKPLFPTKKPSGLRAQCVEEQMKVAPEKEYGQTNRNIRITNGTIDQHAWLKIHYTNEDNQMICQICKDEMPFRKRDGDHYFEAVEALSRDYFAKEHEAQYLALCPLCSAKYTEFVKRDNAAMEKLKSALISSEESEISIYLGELRASISFVESHFQDIKIAVNLRSSENNV